MPGTHYGQKRVLEPVELRLQMVVSHHVDAGNQSQVLCKSSQCSYPLSPMSLISPAPPGVTGIIDERLLLELPPELGG